MASSALARKALWVVVCATTATAVALLLDAADVLVPVERATYDSRVRAFPPPVVQRPPIVLLLIDQKSLDFYAKTSGRGWPWRRDIYGAMIQALGQYGAKLVVFDVLFTEPAELWPEDDATLADATGSMRVIHAMDVNLERYSDVRDVERDLAFCDRRAIAVVDQSDRAWSVVNQLGPPVDSIEGRAAGLGSVRFTPDSDGKARAVEVFVRRGPRFLPSLAMAAALEVTSAPFIDIDADAMLHLAGKAVPLTRDGRVLVRYTGPAQTFPSRSAHALINDYLRALEGLPVAGDWSLLRGAIVLVGASFTDLKHTPFPLPMPGVEVHANLLENLLAGRAVRESLPWVTVVAVAVLSLLIAALLLLSGRPLFSAVLAFGLGAGWVGLATVVFAKSGRWLPIATPLVGATLALIGASVASYALEGRQRRFLRRAFGHYLAPQVIDAMVADPSQLRLGGIRRDITVFFSDLEGFTSFSEKLAPEELAKLLNRYLSEMTRLIMQRQGTLDKFIGDAIMAFWGAPVVLADHAAMACHAALDNVARLNEINDELTAAYGTRLRVRIGLNTGPASVGNMGSEEVFSYTAMGDTVNLASRLEGLNKEYGTRIMASEATRRAAGDGFIWRELDLVAVKGKQIPVAVHELVGRRAEVEPVWLEVVRRYETALKLYRDRQFVVAAEHLGGLLELQPNDAPADALLMRCVEFARSPPPPEWRGELVMKHK